MRVFGGHVSSIGPNLDSLDNSWRSVIRGFGGVVEIEMILQRHAQCFVELIKACVEMRVMPFFKKKICEESFENVLYLKKVFIELYSY